MEKEKEMLSFLFPDYEKIQCRKCRNATGITSRVCLKYQMKPRDVYYENAECPKFEQKQGVEDEE